MQYCTAILKNTIKNAQQELIQIKSKIIDSGNIFVLVHNEYDENGDVQNDFFDIIDFGEKAGLLYVNTIVVPTKEKIEVELPDNVLYVVWFAKDKQKQFFNKDSMRESHIWKDVEWGKREKNYNPKGKDPGNVWIPTKDDGKGKITEHILMEVPDIVSRLFNCGHQKTHKTLFVSNDSKDSIYCNENMQFECSENVITNHIFSKQKQQIICKNKTQNEKDLFAKIIWGTSENMTAIKNETIDLVVTSPPYWDLKDYFKEGQIGQESYQVYLERMYRVWSGCYEKLTKTGSMWVNINVRVKNNKSILLPKDFIVQCKKIGFHYKGISIWHKSSGIPTHDKNIVDRHEYVLVFSKNKNLTINEKINNFSDYKNGVINGGLFWNINRKAGSVGKQLHPAIYPNELVSRIVQSCTTEGQTVLDPFLGSGTTLIAAILANRNCYGYEYNEGFKNLVMGRIENEINTSKKVKICNV
ncbi:MAG: site-specific DNA-methyltransferase [Bacteroidales bacterium]|nr:site-specific DNA-methyltransferase [Bacteroidales bacterium]